MTCGIPRQGRDLRRDVHVEWLGERRAPVRRNKFSHSHGMKRIVAVVFFCLAVGTMAMAETVHFDRDTVGAPPGGWTITKTGKGDPKWTVEKDDTAPSKSNVLKQSGEATYPLALKDGTNIQDGSVEVGFKALSGKEDRAAGIVWRAKDANNYYVVRANALEGNVVLYKTVNGVRSPLDIVGRKGGYGVKVRVPANQWQTLRVDFAGARFTVTFNGKTLFEVEDTTLADAGSVGLWTKADSVTVFDGFTYRDNK